MDNSTTSNVNNIKIRYLIPNVILLVFKRWNIYSLKLQYSFFIIFFIIILGSILPNNKNRLYFYQRNLSTSKIKSVAIGLAEICGKAKAINIAVSPYTATQCIGYIYTVNEITETRDDDGKISKSYREIRREVVQRTFF
ncbi:hypothetical protein ACM39_14520 [Chryseobacterium sp. FH2]|uniref:hypothetical protein n=1 Tax=Chryseobacterium sp. FH2 TaxID=1674291 RepID=UPI00065ACA3D|nr:hypothetical protein [Chryseobacterium sp. FH2]KMQ67012.1 hypothetical protein ACM39_14520 [Chryseobacterium sp. FH2]